MSISAQVIPTQQHNGFITMLCYPWDKDGLSRALVIAKTIAQPNWGVLIHTGASDSVDTMQITRCQPMQNVVLADSINLEWVSRTKWPNIVTTACKGLNYWRQQYNEMLGRLKRVVRLHMDCAGVVFDMTWVRLNYLIVLRKEGDNRYTLLTLKQGDALYTYFPFFKEIIRLQRPTKDGKVIFAKGDTVFGPFNNPDKRPVDLKIEVESLTCQPLSLLTPENNYLETVFQPSPLVREPTVR